ncbi:MAG TPA: YCF48-related protein [Lacunisphaera sp.]|jgi:photosystem II stability/assembly factor-like uncharacterized protein
MRRDAGSAVNSIAAVCRRVSACAVAGLGIAFFGVPMPAYSFETAEAAPLAAHALLLDVAKTSDQLIAVGAYGDVVISRDDGVTWTQIIVPTRALLTAVSFPDAAHGWIVGHDGVILVTDDGGASWTRQDSGKDPDTVFLAVLFRDTTHGFAVGAYGKFLATTDGGKTWIDRKPAAEEVHYNRISVDTAGNLFLAGESGTLLISTDGGEKWRQRNVPYDGSLFGALSVEKGPFLVYGLRGHILSSIDEGATWEPKNSETRVLISCGLRLKSGVVILGGQGGNFFISHDSGESFVTWKPDAFNTSVSAMVEARDDILVTVGEAGAIRIKLP